jgi:hypothetical protein
VCYNQHHHIIFRILVSQHCSHEVILSSSLIQVSPPQQCSIILSSENLIREQRCQISDPRQGEVVLPSGRSQPGRGRGRGPRTGGSQSNDKHLSFTGNCTELQGHIFDCSDSRQADNVRTLKRISEYIGSQYKNGGDIRASIIRLDKITIPLPPAPT